MSAPPSYSARRPCASAYSTSRRSPRAPPAPQALRNTIALARLDEGLGYGRYWVAEHHGGPLLAGASPEALIGPIASATSTHAGGERRRDAAALPPVEGGRELQRLSALFPGRIDLGIGRAAGTDPTTTYALQRNRQAGALDDFPQQLAELMAYLRDEMPDDHAFRRLTALPGLPEAPELWLLGSSAQSAIWAAELGVPYAFADFINPEGAAHAAHYREAYVPSAEHPEPRVIAAVSAICADSDEEAERAGDQRHDGDAPAAPRPPDPLAPRGGGGALHRRRGRAAAGP